MRLIFGLVLLVGIGLAAFTVYAVNRHTTSVEAELRRARAQLAQVRPMETVEIVVASRAVRFGDVLDEEDVRIVVWPKDSQPENGFATLEELFGGEDAEPRTVIFRMEPNEPVLTTKVTGFGESAGMSARLGRGVRAFAIRVDVASGVSGFLTPGDRIDVFWTGRDAGRAITRLILENLPLIAIDQLADSQLNRPVVARTVTVAVPPQQVAFLAQAQATGRLTLSLRGAADEEIMGEVEVDTRMIAGREEEQAEVVEEEEKCFIRQRRGTEYEMVQMECE